MNRYATYRDRMGRKVRYLLNADEEPMTAYDIKWLVAGLVGCLISTGVMIYVYATFA